MAKMESGEFEVRRQLLQMEMLYQIGVALNESLDLHHVAQEVLNRAVVMVDARGGLLLVKDREGEPLRAIARLGLVPEEAVVLLRGAAGESWATRKVLQEENPSGAGRHLCFVPLESRGEVRGLLVVADKERRGEAPGPFGENDEKLLRSFAYQAGAALQNARLHFELQGAYERLKAAQKKLAQQEQLRALGDLAVEVVHELNHVLTTIIGRADVYLNFRQRPEPAMKAIFDTAQQGVAIVERIQRFTQLGVGQRRAAVDLEALIREAVADTQFLWQGRAPQGSAPVTWQLDLHPLPPALVNAAELKEVVTNLLVNALEAMPEGGLVQVRARPAAQGVEVEIRDTGIGMGPEVQQRIFDPFFTTKEGAGKGLGLSIAFRIIDAHEGEIAVESAPGQGTCFRVRLPLRPKNPPAPQKDDVEAYFGG
jgi:signal transduction histidine kinase